MKKFLALLLSVALCLAIVPAIGADTTNETKVKTDAEIEAQIDSLLSFYDATYNMVQTYGIKDDMKSADDDPFATARLIVKSAHELDYTGAVAYVNGHNDTSIIQYATPADAEAALERYQSLSYVEYACADGIVSIDGEEEGVDAVPGDYTYVSWGWKDPNYGAHAASYNAWLYEYAQQDLNNLPEILVAVIDTGVDSDHEMLEGRLVSDGYDFINNDSNPEDDHGHGTHVSGTIADGTFSNVKIMGIKVLNDDGRGYDYQVAAGMEWAYLHGCNIANMSLGGDCTGPGSSHHELYRGHIVTAQEQYNCMFVVAAGNEAENANNHCPANVTEALTVANHARNGQLSSTSNYGAVVDVSAPGEGILSARMGGGRTMMSGTSMATPHVAAVVAMIKSVNPDYTVEEITSFIQENSKPHIFTSPAAGSGYLDTEGLWELFGETPTPVPPTPGNGDANGDGTVNLEDAILVQHYALALIGDSDLNLIAADVNGDGVVDMTDASLIARMSIG